MKQYPVLRRYQLGTVSLNAQSTLTASGFIPVVFNGVANFSAIATLFADGHANPPWVFALIEFSGETVSNTKELTMFVTKSYEGSSDSVVSIEGG